PLDKRILLCFVVRRRPISTLFPYTTLFRSGAVDHETAHGRVVLEGMDLLQCLPVEGFRQLVILRVHVVIELDDIVAHLKAVVVADRKSTRLNSSHVKISYAVFCLKKKTTTQ